MRRITVWITTTAAVVALALSYQLSLSGDGKDGDHGAVRAACPPTTTTTSRPTPAACSEQHEGKPGEQK